MKQPQTIGGLKVHPAANCLPMMDDERFAELVKSIREHGYDKHEPVVVHEGKILDGRHRALAAKKAGVEPLCRQWSGERGSPVAFALSANLHRRDLTKEQRLAAAEKFTPLLAAEAAKRKAESLDRSRPKGRKKKDPVSAPNGADTKTAEKRATAEAAKLAGVSQRSLERFRRVRAHDSELADRVIDRELTLAAAERLIAKKPKPVKVPRNVKKIKPPKVHEGVEFQNILLGARDFVRFWRDLGASNKILARVLEVLSKEIHSG